MGVVVVVMRSFKYKDGPMLSSPSTTKPHAAYTTYGVCTWCVPREHVSMDLVRKACKFNYAWHVSQLGLGCNPVCVCVCVCVCICVLVPYV